MKLFCLLASALLLYSSCKKESVGSEITGTWELATVSGGFSGTTTNYAAGNGNIIELGKFGIYKTYRHDTLTYSGTYTLTKKVDCGYSERKTFFANSQYGSSFESVISVENNQLIIGPSCQIADGNGFSYRRINK